MEIKKFNINNKLGQRHQIGLSIDIEKKQKHFLESLLREHQVFFPRAQTNFDEYTFFYYLSSNNLSLESLSEKVSNLLKKYTIQRKTISYENWLKNLDEYIDKHTQEQSQKTNGHDVDWISLDQFLQSKEYRNAENYIRQDFDETNVRMIHYLIYIYGEQNRQDEIIKLYNKNQSLLNTSPSSIQIITTIAKAFIERNPQITKEIIENHLPEFGRVGIGSKLIDLKMQAEVLLQELPDAPNELKEYIRREKAEILRYKLQDILQLANKNNHLPEVIELLQARLDENDICQLYVFACKISYHTGHFEQSSRYFQISKNYNAENCINEYVNLGDIDYAKELLEKIGNAEQKLVVAKAIITCIRSPEDIHALRKYYKATIQTSNKLKIARVLALQEYRECEYNRAQELYSLLKQNIGGIPHSLHLKVFEVVDNWLNGNVIKSQNFLELSKQVSLQDDVPEIFFLLYEIITQITFKAKAKEKVCIYECWRTSIIRSLDFIEALIWIQKVADENFTRLETYLLIGVLQKQMAHFPYMTKKIAEIYSNILVEEIDHRKNLSDQYSGLLLDLKYLDEKLHQKVVDYYDICTK